MTSTTEPASDGMKGLAFVLVATAIAGAVGYAIQLLAPATLADPRQYVAFTVFWSTLYLLVGAVGGLQQEVTRATSAGTERSTSALRDLTVWGVVLLGSAAVVIGLAVGPSSFGGEQVPMALWLGVGVAGYLLVAVFSGVLYGLRVWSAIAAITIADAVLRGALVTAGLLLGAPPAMLGGAVALPFGLAFLLVWIGARRRVVGRFVLDVSLRRLVINSLTTMTAAVAIGVVVTGLPLVMSLTMSAQDVVAVATLISVVTIARAPLIIPLFALQSYLIVHFRGTTRVTRALWRYGAAILLATAAGMVFAYLLGPGILRFISGGRFVIEPVAVTLVVLSAGIVALLALAGAALLAQSHHKAYAAGWVVAALATVGLLVVPTDPVVRTLTAIVAAPVAGFVVHLIAIGGASRNRGSSPPPPAAHSGV